MHFEVVYMPEFTTKITRIRDYPVPEGAATRVFECHLPENVQFPYTSGQFAMIAHPEIRLLANQALMKWSSYSISSSPQQKGILEFCIGDGSPTGVSHKLMHLKQGEEFLVKGPFGKFLLDENQEEYVFLATGTGIAPLISMIRTLLAKGNTKPITLYFGFRYPSQYMYHEELTEMQAKHPNFKAVITASRPDANWEHHHGYVQDVLKNHQTHDKKKVRVYICGKPEIAEKLVEFCVKDMQFAEEQVMLEKW